MPLRLRLRIHGVRGAVAVRICIGRGRRCVRLDLLAVMAGLGVLHRCLALRGRRLCERQSGCENSQGQESHNHLCPSLEQPCGQNQKSFEMRNDTRPAGRVLPCDKPEPCTNLTDRAE